MNRKESGYRWAVFGAVLFVYVTLVSQRTAPGLITDQLMKTFHVSASSIGWMSSIQFLAYAGFQIPVGLLSDRYGPNRFLIVGTFIAGLGTLLTGFASNEWMLLAARFLDGMGDATIFINFVLILSKWFNGNEFVKLLGFVGLGAGFGSLFATIPLSAWISETGWRNPFVTIGILLVVCAVVLYVVLVAKPRIQFADESESHLYTMKRDSIRTRIGRMFITRQAWATFLCHFGLVGTYIGFIGSWGVPYGIHVYGLSRFAASQLIMYGLFGAMIGGPLISWIASRLASVKKIYTLIHLLVVLSWLGWFMLGTRPPFVWVVILLFLIGFGNGASSLTFVVVRKSFRTEEVGSVSGFANMGGFSSAILLPIIFGSVLDAFPAHTINLGYHFGLVIPIIFASMGLMGSLLINEKMVTESLQT